MKECLSVHDILVTKGECIVIPKKHGKYSPEENLRDIPRHRKMSVKGKKECILERNEQRHRKHGKNM